jgi:NitT/TauT family transport system ATP-binding protein
MAQTSDGTTSSSSPPPALETRLVEKAFQKDGTVNHVLSHISLVLGPGELGALIGPSGCGKSTFLKIVAGLEPFDSGEIEVLGRQPGFGRFDIGFVFQSLALFPWRTVLQNVLLPTEFTKLNRAEALDKAKRYLAMVGLEGYEHYHIREISGGMQQRVALARVLMGEAKLLLLDEPFGALDELTREAINVVFMDIFEREGLAALLVTHSIQEAVLMSDKVFVMSGRPAQIVEEVPVPIARPRRRAVMVDDAFIAATGRVRRALGLEEGSELEVGTSTH